MRRIFYLTLFKLGVEPDEAVFEGLMKSVLHSELNHLFVGGALNLNHYLIGNFLVANLLGGHYAEEEEVFILHASVYDLVAFADKGLAAEHGIFIFFKYSTHIKPPCQNIIIINYITNNSVYLHINCKY